MRFGPRGDSVVLAVSTSSARVALPTLPTTNPAVALVARGAHQGVWWVKFGDSSVAATITDAKRYEPGSKEHPLIIPITGSPTHVAILAEGEPGDVLITSGQELLGEFAPSGTASLIDVTQTSAVVALPTLGSPIGAISLICENPLTEALRVKFGNSGATGSDSTSMRVHPGSAADPVILRPTNSETHLAIYCEGEPGRVILTPGALNAGIGNLSPSQARDFLDLNTTDSPTFTGLTLNNAAGETKLVITNSNPTGNKNSGIEIGRTDNVAASAYIDFHSGATSVDYDVRIIATNGAGSDGGGDLVVTAQTINLNATNVQQQGNSIRPVVSATQATTSGTSFDFTGIPSHVSKIHIAFNGVSLSGTDDLLVQIGDSGGVETSGYLSGSGDSGTQSASSAGFHMRNALATSLFNGAMTLVKVDTNTWVSAHSGGRVTAAVAIVGDTAGGGSKVLSAGPLDRVRILATGANTFDLGTVNIVYE